MTAALQEFQTSQAPPPQSKMILGEQCGASLSLDVSMSNTSCLGLFQSSQVAKYHLETLKDRPSVVVSDQNVSYRDDTSSDSDDSGLEGVV